jgi:hypothetical protein
MNSIDQKKITKNLTVLQKELQDDVDIITDKLYKQKVFTREVWQDICDTRCRLQKSNCSSFINHLLRSGKDSYAKFKNILIDLGHHKLVTALEKASQNGKKVFLCFLLFFVILYLLLGFTSHQNCISYMATFFIGEDRMCPSMHYFRHLSRTNDVP